MPCGTGLEHTVKYAILLLLAGCAVTPPRVYEGTAYSVSVDRSVATNGNAGGMLGLADAWCQKYGKHAQFAARLTDFQNSYNCVP